MKQNQITRKTFAISVIALATLALSPLGSVAAEKAAIPKHDGKPADMTKPVQVFVLLGQSSQNPSRGQNAHAHARQRPAQRLCP